MCFWVVSLFAAVVSAQNTGDVRLRGGATSNQGRVEIYYRNRWGTVCDDIWNLKDSNVVCRQLGYSSALTYHRNAYYGEGVGPIWIDNVACSGTELRLLYCRFHGYGIQDCSHSEDVGVYCTIDSISSGSVRLVRAGLTSNVGRVEVYHSGQWGTVCDDGWDFDNTVVVCRQLGYSGATTYKTNAFYGQGTGSIWMDGVDCSGSESTLSSCRFNGWGVGDCGHSEDVGVVCSNSSASSQAAANGDVRLVGGSSSDEGRVEIYYNGLWGTVCDDYFDDVDAEVVCRQLGYSTSQAKARGDAYYGQGSGTIWLDNVRCYGSESRLSSCSHNGWRNGDCDHSEDVGVDCNDKNSTVTIAVSVSVALGCLIIVVVSACSYRYIRRRGAMRMNRKYCDFSDEASVCSNTQAGSISASNPSLNCSVSDSQRSENSSSIFMEPGQASSAYNTQQFLHSGGADPVGHYPNSRCPRPPSTDGYPRSQ